MELLFAFTMHSQGSGAMIHPIISDVEYTEVLPLLIILIINTGNVGLLNR